MIVHFSKCNEGSFVHRFWTNDKDDESAILLSPSGYTKLLVKVTTEDAQQGKVILKTHEELQLNRQNLPGFEINSDKNITIVDSAKAIQGLREKLQMVA